MFYARIARTNMEATNKIDMKSNLDIFAITAYRDVSYGRSDIF